MLGIKAYPREYVNECRSRVSSDVAKYRDLMKVATGSAANGGATASNAAAAFEASYFNNMVILLDALFVHRLRTVEGKDGNPLNEVRVLSESMLLHHNVMTPEKTIKLTPAKSVLKYEFGDEISVKEDEFVRLSDAFFAEIERKFV